MTISQSSANDHPENESKEEEVDWALALKRQNISINKNLNIAELTTPRIIGFEFQKVQKVKLLLDSEIESNLISKTFEIPKQFSSNQITQLASALQRFKLRTVDELKPAATLTVKGLPSVLTKFNDIFNKVQLQ
mmetsp:Transcript_24135/g.21201  ORF Transcript_24135/g.21201 Transcript_24135/m.21201 type:complete len:134 (+) Transcript_24135:1297-1698(+)